MKPGLAFLFLALSVSAAAADTVVPTRTIRSQAIIGPADLTLVAGEVPGTYVDPADIIGQETRVVLYAGRPVRIEDVGPPALVDRNQIVTLYFRAGGLTIVTEARALARGGVGDSIRVMNLTSRTTVTGIVRQDGTVSVGGPAFQ